MNNLKNGYCIIIAMGGALEITGQIRDFLSCKFVADRV